MINDVENCAEKWLVRLGWKFSGQIWWERCDEQLYGTIELTIVWTKLMEHFLEPSGAQNWCKIWWYNWGKRFIWKMGGQFVVEIGWTI